MKIEAAIQPRRDGTVKATLDAVEYVFSKDDQERLVCDVENKKHIADLLNTGNFIPADEGDFELAAALSAPPVGDEDDDDDDMPGGTDVDSESIPAVPPVEENTPPSTRKPRKAK